MVGGVMVFIVVVVYFSVAGLFGTLLAPKIFAKYPLTDRNIMAGIVCCVWIALCVYLVLTL